MAEIELEKYDIDEAGKPWVLRAICDAWKTSKSRIKSSRDSCYDNDDDRLKNRPTDVPLQEFKDLIKHWSNPKVQEIAAQNAASWRKLTNPHTIGPVSFTQVGHKMKLENNGQDPSMADLFIMTHKRKDGREYKSDSVAINYKLAWQYLVRTVRVLSSLLLVIPLMDNHGWLGGMQCLRNRRKLQTLLRPLMLMNWQQRLKLKYK